MKFTNYLHKNIKWNFHKNVFADLCCAPTDENALWSQMHRLSERYFPQRQKVETTYTEFCLNEIAFFRPKTEAQKCVKQLFDGFWQSFLRVKSVFEKPFLLLPSDGNNTRLETISKLVAQCTQFALSNQEIQLICNKIQNVFDLQQRELANLRHAITLYKINFYCALAKRIFAGDSGATARLAKMLDNCEIAGDYRKNEKLQQVGFSTELLAASVNCLSNSATKFHAPTEIDLKAFFFCNGKNVFDTFCFSKLGKHTAQFLSHNGKLTVEMQYFLQNSCEVRRYTVTNNGAHKKITADFLFRHLNLSNKTSYFPSNGALCLAVDGQNCFYCAVAMVANNKVLGCEFEEGRLSYRFDVPQEDSVRFDVVCAYAANMPDLADILQNLNGFGATRCPYLGDSLSQNVTTFPHKLQPTSHGYALRQSPQKQATTFNFSYQLGNETCATFLDNAGNCTTLLGGFAFGVGGEKVFSVKNGVMRRINCGKFSLQTDSVVYTKKDAVCEICHGEGKTYKTTYAQKQKTLFFFPLEEKSKITFCNNVFCVQSNLRNFEISCVGKVESFTTNVLECNEEKLRYKLSDDLQSGTCLAICFATANNAELKICSQTTLPSPCPLVRESLISTYLNYLNNKNVFCLQNFLKRADSLTLAAICFTNPQYVKFFAQNMFEKNRFYYDVAGQKKHFFDKLALPLAIVYYANLTNDKTFPTTEMKRFASSVLFKETFAGKDLCIKALALKKAAQLDGFDKVKCLVEYNNAKRAILKDSKTYGFAQAIGAVSLHQPSKDRLKDLCRKFDVPKSWYYVSQLENLYGLTLCDGTLNFAPKVTQPNVLEQLSVCVQGKRIDTTFSKATVQSLTLNGVQYFLPLKTQSLKNQQNTLVVRY